MPIIDPKKSRGTITNGIFDPWLNQVPGVKDLVPYLLINVDVRLF